jgi:hypothetical protein
MGDHSTADNGTNNRSVDLSAKYPENMLAYDEKFAQALRINGLDMPVRLIEAISRELEVVSTEQPEDAFTRESALMGSIFLSTGIALERLGAICFALKHRREGFLLKYLSYRSKQVTDIYKEIASMEPFHFEHYFDLTVDSVADPSAPKPKEAREITVSFGIFNRYLPLAAKRFLHPAFPLNSIKHGTLFFRDPSFLLPEMGPHFLGNRVTKENDSIFFLVKPGKKSSKGERLTTIRMSEDLELSFSGFALSPEALEDFHKEVRDYCSVTEEMLCLFISYCRNQRSQSKHKSDPGRSLCNCSAI